MSKISEENIIRILSRLDVPGNAAKIYIFLLKNGPSTGYAVSKRSGVNNAVVYRELERLKNRNLVYQLGNNLHKAHPRLLLLPCQEAMQRLTHPICLHALL